MADAIVSVVAERLADIIAEQIRDKVKLVRGVDKEVLNLSEELKTIVNVLEDADRRRFKDKSIKGWLKRLEDVSNEIDGVLDEWNIAALKLRMDQSANLAGPHKSSKVCSFIPSSCLCFKKVAVRHDIAKKIVIVKAKLDGILAGKDRYGFVTSQPVDPSRESRRPQTTSLIDLEEVHGRDFDRDDLVSKLVHKGGGSQEELGIDVLSIVGVGGVGKTTLAQLTYNDSQVKECFEFRIWIYVSDPFDEAGIAKGIIEKAGGTSPNTNQMDMLLQCLRESISGKKFLLVLDDVWTQNDTKWKPLKSSLRFGGAGSKILVTTRNERVAIMMGSTKNEIHHLGSLSDEDCWLLLRRIALSEKNEEDCEKLQSIGKNIAIKCKGLPLATKTLGSLLRFKNTLEEWENVLNSEIWELEEAEVDIFPPLLLSYNELSPALKCCFSYCAVFPKDSQIDVKSLIIKWMALGYLGSNESSGDWKLRGREYFDNLAMRSLFQDFEKGDFDEQVESFKMHDILHDFAQFLRKNGEVGTRMKRTTCQACSPSLISHVKEYRSLFCNKEPPPHLCDCLASLRLLSLRDCGLQSIPHEIEKLIHLRWLDLGCNKLPMEDLKTICELYNLQFLWVDNCKLKELPWQIGNLIHLRHLDLSWNKLVKELPESICCLHELESLDIDCCERLSGLPEGIHRLINLKHLYNTATHGLKQFPQALAELTGLRTLSRFCGGRRWSKLGSLKNLNRLSGTLALMIELTDDPQEVVEDAREAELRKKMHIQTLQIYFSNLMGEDGDSVWIDVVDALEPHPNLQNLEIWDYRPSRLPRWIVSPLRQLRSIKLLSCTRLSSLPPLGKLPCLENIEMYSIYELQFLAREFLGITTIETGGDMNIESSSSSSLTAATHNNANTIIGFPKLKKLVFADFEKWKEWEDITAEEEDSKFVSLMPCLTELSITGCKDLTVLPHRLLRKVSSSLKVLDISDSTQLELLYGDKNGEAWKSISHHNPHLLLEVGYHRFH